MYEGAVVAGKYRIEHVLGRGGMGVVVAATHMQLGTRVALKFLNEKMTGDQKVVARFLREARASASLKSEHVCRVSDFGTEGSVPYIVMELLEGTDLSRLVKLRPLDVGTAAEYIMQACMGLAEAHAAGIIHRDLKPGNLFLTQRPTGAPLVKVLDFGVAKVAETEDFSLTQTSNVVGSPGFMSPEQLRSARQVDQRSDIWSLGVILYKIVSGRQPFRAEALTDLAISIAMDPVPPLHEASPEFTAVVMKCLEKDPARRFQNVNELGNALSRFAAPMARQTTSFFSPDESSIQQSHLLAQRPMPPVVMPGSNDYSNGRLTITPDPPTTLQGASSVVDALSPAAPRNKRRGVVIGLSAMIVIGIGIGVGIGTSGDTGPASMHSIQETAHPAAQGAASNAGTGPQLTVPASNGATNAAGATNASGTNAADTNTGANGTATNSTASTNTAPNDNTNGANTNGANTNGTNTNGANTNGANTNGANANGTTAAGTTNAASATPRTASTGTTVGSGARRTTTTATPTSSQIKKNTSTTTPSKTDPKTTKPKDFGASRI